MIKQEVPDLIGHNLKILFIGFNPGRYSAESGHHFAGPSNRFWKMFFEAGFTPGKLKPSDEKLLLRLGYGITNIVARPTRSAAEINKDEYIVGRKILKQKLLRYKPHFACYVGIGVYKEFAQSKVVKCGSQPHSIVSDVVDYVVYSTSGLTTVPFQQQLFYFNQLYTLVEG